MQHPLGFNLYVQFYITCIICCYTMLWRIMLNHGEREASDVLPASVTAVGEDACSSSVGAICLLGRFNSSNVIPSSLVIPTIGASPFLTNSHWPVRR